MGFCRENLKGACDPFSCRKSGCLKGEILREILPTSRCKEECVFKQGIGDSNPCKDAMCPIGNTIIKLRKLK